MPKYPSESKNANQKDWRSGERGAVLPEVHSTVAVTFYQESVFGYLNIQVSDGRFQNCNRQALAYFHNQRFALPVIAVSLLVHKNGKGRSLLLAAETLRKGLLEVILVQRTRAATPAEEATWDEPSLWRQLLCLPRSSALWEPELRLHKRAAFPMTQQSVRLRSRLFNAIFRRPLTVKLNSWEQRIWRLYRGRFHRVSHSSC
jgi:hypothetical protein